jgi:hypothetical protein
VLAVTGVSSLTLLGGFTDINNVTIFQDSVHVPMLVQQACVSKANSLQGQNFSLIALNYSILEFVKRASSVEFPTAVQNSSIFQALFYDIVEYVDMVSFYNDVFDAVQMKGLMRSCFGLPVMTLLTFLILL